MLKDQAYQIEKIVTRQEQVLLVNSKVRPQKFAHGCCDFNFNFSKLRTQYTWFIDLNDYSNNVRDNSFLM